jgi:hypothetical protein
MRQRSIPCIFMRGGTSRGPYFLASDLPSDRAERERTLLAVMGSPDVRQIDGLGGADTLTSKVAIVSKSARAGVDVDYLFAQVIIDRPLVDTAPSCGNMLAGVGPFAIERGLVVAEEGETRVRIYDVNTQSRIEAVVQTPGRVVNYVDGDARIDGVPGSAAPLMLNFMDIVGSKTGKLLPTGNVVDEIGGVAVSCVDVAMPMMLARADAFGLTGHESRAEIDAMKDLVGRIELIRLEAGRRMGLGDVSKSVVPKVGLLAPPRGRGDIASRYFTPWALHATHAVTGGICISSALSIEGSIAHQVARSSAANPRDVVIEHPSGEIEVRLTTRGRGTGLEVVSAGTLRTARLIMKGEVYVPVRAGPASAA